MRTSIFLAALTLLFCTPGFAQKHAPTVDVCRADVAVWYNTDISTEYYDAQRLWDTDKVPNRTDIAKLPIQEATARQGEMLDCTKVDEEKKEIYFKASDFYYDILADRVMQFMVRHKLWDQFRKEDAAGQR